MALQFGMPLPPLDAGARIGQGVSGHVFRTVLERGGLVAVKVYPFEGPDPAFRARDRFWRECLILSRIRHPSYPALYGCGEEEGNTGYAVMEWIEGDPLDHYRDASVEIVLRLSFQLLTALLALHRLGFIHRDVAFDNILVEKRRSGLVPRIIDLGVAKDLNAGDPITLPGSFLGRLGYAPPEALTILGSRGADTPKCDVFAFGVLLFEWLCGHPPFPGETPAEVLKSQQKKNLPRFKLQEGRGPGEQELSLFITSLLERESAKRPDAEAALAHLLEIRRRIPLSRPPRRTSRPDDLLIDTGASGWQLQRFSFPAVHRFERLLDVDPVRGAEVEEAEGLSTSPEEPGLDQPFELEDIPKLSVGGIAQEIGQNPLASRLFLATSIIIFLITCLAAYFFVFR